MISFSVNAADQRMADRIADRALAMAKEARGDRCVRTKLDYTMDVTATHANGCPLDLQRLLDADDFNFAHDIFGIERHLCRRTGKLQDCFLPRFADRSQNVQPGDSLQARRSIQGKRTEFERRRHG